MSIRQLRSLERAIVSRLNAARRGSPPTCREVAEELGGGVDSLAVRHLLGELDSCGVIEMVGDRVRLSPGVQRLASLGLLSTGRSRASVGS